MVLNFDSSTDLSLLCKVSKGDPTSWDVFVKKYGGVLRHWSLKWGGSSEDAEDFVQEILIRVFQKLDRYQVQEGSRFRSWLKAVAYHCWLDLRRKFLQSHPLDAPESLPDDLRARLASSLACNDLIAVFESMADQEILNLAMLRVKARVNETSWLCFERFYWEHESGPQIAAQQNMDPAAVFMAVSRVRKMIRDEALLIDSTDRTESSEG